MNGKIPLRVKLSVGILCGVLAASVTAFSNVQLRCRRLLAETENAVAQIAADGIASDEIAERIGALWQKEERWLRLALSGEVLADLNEAVCRLPAEHDSPETMAAELRALSGNLRQIMRQERSVF